MGNESGKTNFTKQLGVKGGGELAKATLTPLGIYLGPDESKGSISDEKPITVLFNPREFSIEKSVNWQAHGGAGADTQTLEYTGSDTEILSLELFADTSRQSIDVRAYTEQLRELSYPHEKLGHPRVIRFDWGPFSFKGFITQITQKFTQVQRSGLPVRATISLTIKALPAPFKGDPVSPTPGGTRPTPSGTPPPPPPPPTTPPPPTPPPTPAPKAPELKLKVIGPGNNLSGSADWVEYHHSLFYVELHIKYINKVTLAVAPWKPWVKVPMITGVWKQKAAGSVEPLSGFDFGGVGEVGRHHAGHKDRCYFYQQFGEKYGPQGHPNKWHDRRLWDTVVRKGETTLNLGASEKWVIAVYLRSTGTFTLTAIATPPYKPEATEKPEELKEQVSLTFSAHPHPGD